MSLRGRAELSHQLATACDEGDIESCFVLADALEEDGALDNANYWRGTAEYKKAWAEGKKRGLARFPYITPIRKDAVARLKKTVKAFGLRWPRFKGDGTDLPDGTRIFWANDGFQITTDNASIETWIKFGTRRAAKKKYPRQRAY